MAYDQGLAARVRAIVNERIGGGAPADEKRMFGGLAFMVNTHMAVGLHNGGGLIMPVGADGEPAAIERGAVPMTMGGRSMSGWVVVPDDVIADDAELASWVESGVAGALAKEPKKPAGNRQVG
ncbi:TfoX/Sxy family protein [Xylanimonas sp. McL0601]|uniref:TfoX/Sxy family protein n=1 Tax=Xylanimonas sp. McL0601 TaxID=3414739 RepID=UPI003CE91F98